MTKEEQIVKKARSWAKGEVPEHLKPFSDNLAEASRECARELKEKDLEGQDKVSALNSCISQKLKKMNEKMKEDNENE